MFRTKLKINLSSWQRTAWCQSDACAGVFRRKCPPDAVYTTSGSCGLSPIGSRLCPLLHSSRISIPKSNPHIFIISGRSGSNAAVPYALLAASSSALSAWQRFISLWHLPVTQITSSYVVNGRPNLLSVPVRDHKIWNGDRERGSGCGAF